MNVPKDLERLRSIARKIENSFSALTMHISDLISELDNLENISYEQAKEINHYFNEMLSSLSDILNWNIEAKNVLLESLVNLIQINIKNKEYEGGEQGEDSITHVQVFTDGSCLGNPGPGGWSAIIIDEFGNETKISGNEKDTTNNRMELISVIEALKMIPKNKNVIVYTDSRYIRDAFEEKYIEKWIQNGWRTSSKKEVANQDLWKQLYNLVNQFQNVKFVWLASHSYNNGDFFSVQNNKVDSEARRQAKMAMMGWGTEIK